MEKEWCLTEKHFVRKRKITERARDRAIEVGTGFFNFPAVVTNHTARCPNCGRAFKLRGYHCHDLCCTWFYIPRHKKFTKPKKKQSRGK